MKVQTITPCPSLREYVDRIFVLSCAGKLPQDDLKLIVPNGRVKLVIPHGNALTAGFNGRQYRSPADNITLIGLCDRPSLVDFETNAPGGSITVEFSPLGAYRFLDVAFHEIKNVITPFGDLAGNAAVLLEERLAQAEAVSVKVGLVQEFLVSVFMEHRHDPLFDWCVRKIMGDKGRTPVSGLEKMTGYSARWLNAKFTHRIGTSAKNLASIVRFHAYYQRANHHPRRWLAEKDFYEDFYDQSHFIRDFKRFAGYAPAQLSAIPNLYGVHLFRE